ncbi:RNA-binding protein [Caulobacter sp. Root487D2Y]|uniref:RNA-binding S4 domain-containing protein n=1 Tax=Caulobacter sp. Root487D2Y TaxID=1736547 RepID=UPI0006F451C3|nr:RNA-binding S4 domain-containing protein [Caulobacter sp. Root487D2Y]KQY35852.1 RNA-binding protein [Caulobacter sp. Root487D2Y]
MSGADAGPDPGHCRADVWLWRARFFKTRSLAGRFVEEGRIRLTRAGAEGRVDKPSRGLRIGDGLVFAIGGRIVSVRVLGFGERRGPATEARELYEAVGE